MTQADMIEFARLKEQIRVLTEQRDEYRRKFINARSELATYRAKEHGEYA